MIMSWLKNNNIVKYQYGEKEIFYSPIGRCYVVADSEQYEQFQANGNYKEVFEPLSSYVPLSEQRKVRAPKDYTLLTVLPNNVCNFACSYCYSAQGRNGSQITEDKLLPAIDYFFDSKESGYDRPLTISFMGGGEPLLSWELVKKGAEYALQKAHERGLRLNLRIITNGSIVDNEKIAFLKANKVEISVSFEILREIQNMQRKNYELVFSNIKTFLQEGIDVQINSTITPHNVDKMREMIEELHSQFPEIRNAMFEPVVAQNMFSTPAEMHTFYERYIEEFVNSRKLANEYGIGLTSFAYLRTIFPLERACPGELCITADGDFTGCYCVATDKEPLFKLTKYGTVKNGIVLFDEKQYKWLLDQNVYSKSECTDCEVKWNCGGGCFHQYRSYSEEYREEVCRFTRKFVEEIVKYKVERFMKSQVSVQAKLPILLREEMR